MLSLALDIAVEVTGRATLKLKTEAQRDCKGRHCLESLERCSILLSICAGFASESVITGFFLCDISRAPADKLDFKDAARWPIARNGTCR